MNVYTPTDLQAQICATLRSEDRIARLVTDEQIYDAVACAVSHPSKVLNNDVLLWTRIELINAVLRNSPYFGKERLIGEKLIDKGASSAPRSAREAATPST